MDPEREAHEAFKGVLRYYELAKRQEWQVRDLPWGDVPPIPEGKGSEQRQARRRDMWRSVLTQQLQADMLACEMSSQLLNIAPDPEAKLYYSTMVQDESRHTEAWLKLIEEAGGTAERDPYLDELAHMTLEADTLEEKVFQMQVFYERLIISRFRLIARSSHGTVLEDLCNRLTTDDGIHHGSRKTSRSASGSHSRSASTSATSSSRSRHGNHDGRGAARGAHPRGGGRR